MANIVDELTDEILRVTEIQREYVEAAELFDSNKFNNKQQKKILLITAQTIQLSIDTAKQAQGSGGILNMISALKQLQEITG